MSRPVASTTQRVFHPPIMVKLLIPADRTHNRHIDGNGSIQEYPQPMLNLFKPYFHDHHCTEMSDIRLDQNAIFPGQGGRIEIISII